MKNIGDKLSDIDAKIEALQKKKKTIAQSLEKSRLKNLEKIGLFDLPDLEAYGLVIDSLSKKDDVNIRGVWKSQGEKFLV